MIRVGKKKRVLFLCKGTAREGLGHVIRSRAVAQLMSAQAIVKMCCIGDRYATNLLSDRGFDFEVVQDDQYVLHVFNDFLPDIVVIDLLRLETELMKALRTASQVACLSPLFNHFDQVDIVFSRTRGPFGPEFDETDRPILRCGPAYMVVSEHCKMIPEDLYRQNLNRPKLSVAISMGGTDANNKTLMVLDTIKQVERPMVFWVMLGEGYAHSFQDLVDAMDHARQHEIVLAKTSDSMWQIAGNCCVGILMCGITAYEAAYAGLPAIILMESSEDELLLDQLTSRGACFVAGHPFEASLHRLAKLLPELEGERERLRDARRNLSGVIDRRGAERIVDEILGGSGVPGNGHKSQLLAESNPGAS